MTIEEIKIELNLRVYKKSRQDFLRSIGRICDNRYFIIVDDGTCHLFDEDGNEDDISKIKKLDSDLVPKDIISIVIPDSVTRINNSTFKDCNKLRDVTIPNSVTSIGFDSFEYCSNLMGIIIPNSVTSIGEYVFKDCTSLVNITIPDSITNIENCLFANCSNLMNVTIPDSVISIGDGTFYSCSEIKRMTIPISVTSIGRYVFYGCSKLKSLVFKGKTLGQIKAMQYYPFGLEDESIIRCEIA